jgi:hypothetical protein
VLKNKLSSDQASGKLIPFITMSDLDTSLKTAHEKYGKELFTCEKIKPNGTCIGGIYGIDIDLLRKSTSERINDNDRSGCIDKERYNQPVACTDKN